MLNNAGNNVVTMQMLQSELQSPKHKTKIQFNALNNCICCYTHIINICSSHIVASVTSTTKHQLSNLQVPLSNDSDNHPDDNNSNDSSNNDSDDGSDDNNSDNGLDNDDFDNGSENDNSDNELDNSDVNLDHVVAKLELAKGYDIKGNHKLRQWLTGIQHNPLSHAQKVVCLLCSSDQHREGF